MSKQVVSPFDIQVEPDVEKEEIIEEVSEGTEQPEISLEPNVEEETEKEDSTEPLVGERTGTSVIAEYYKNKGYLPEDFEVKDDLSSDDFFETFARHIEEQKEQEVTERFQAKGYDEQILEYSQYIASGGSPQALETHVVLDRLANANVEDNEKTQEEIVRYMLQDRGLDDDTIDTTVQALLDGDKLHDKAQAAKQYFSQRRDGYLSELKREQENQMAEQQAAIKQQTENFRKLIQSGDMPTIEKKKFEREFLEPTEVITIDTPDGKKQKQKITKFQKVMRDIQASPEKTLKLAHIILSGLDNVKQQAQQEGRDELLNLLDGKTTIKADQTTRTVKRLPWKIKDLAESSEI